MKPATPLPWECPGTDGEDYVICASPKGKRRTIAHVYRHSDLGIKREENAAYIVHAANSYPELVAALRSMMAECTRYRRLNEQARELQDIEGDQIRLARALLARLGEDK